MTCDISCPHCGLHFEQPKRQPGRPRIPSEERLERVRENNRRYYEKSKDIRREVHNESRRRYYHANREAILVKNRELRALGRAAKQALDAREPNQDRF